MLAYILCVCVYRKDNKKRPSSSAYPDDDDVGNGKHNEKDSSRFHRRHLIESRDKCDADALQGFHENGTEIIMCIICVCVQV
jgi:hypothetical protein